jgi:hypothetical protein
MPKKIFLHEKVFPHLGALLNTIDHGGLALQLDRHKLRTYGVYHRI